MMDRTSAQASTTSAGTGKPTPSSPQNKTGIADQIESLRSDMSGLAEKVTGLTKEQLSQTLSSVESAASEKTQDFKASIIAKPMQAIAVSVAVGFVMGLLLSR